MIMCIGEFKIQNTNATYGTFPLTVLPRTLEFLSLLPSEPADFRAP